MTQIAFSSDTTPALADLDANFSELYALFNKWYQATSALGVLSAPTLATDGSYSIFQVDGGAALSSSGSNFALLSGNMGGTPSVPTRIGAFGASYYLQTSGVHIWAFAPSGSAGSAATFTEAARLSSGSFLLGTASTWSGNLSRFSLNYLGGVSEYGLTLNTPATTGRAINFIQGGNSVGGGSPTQVGSITTTTTATAYNTSSDYRLKDGFTPITQGECSAFIDALNPGSFTWKCNGAPGRGFLAHELQAVSPTSVDGEKDAAVAIGNLFEGDTLIAANVPQPAPLLNGHSWVEAGLQPVMQAVEYGSAELIAMLVAEMKFLRARVAALEAA
jgi:hypothetical protein